MAKQKYSTDFKRQVVLHYLNGHDGAKKTAALFGVDHGAVRRWTEHWKVSGEDGLTITTKAYSAEFKEEVLHWMQENNASSRKAAAAFKIAAACTVSRWARLYREGGIMALSDKRTERIMASGKKPPNKPLTAPYPTFHSAQEELEYLRAENAYPKKAACLGSGKAAEKAKIVSELRQDHQLATLLHIAWLPRSTFYWQVKSGTSAGTYEHEAQRIKALFHHHKGRYGYRRITLALRNEGCLINHKTVRKLMREQDLASNLRRKKYRSYKGTYGHIAPNLLQRDFHADAPNQKWVTDVTEFNLKGQKLYLSPVLDLYNSEIIAWQMATHQGMRLVDKMLDDALATLGPTDAPVLHSDQGWQYQMASYQTRLSSRDVKQSMSRKGNCLDNAVVENFFGLLKSECWFNEEYEDTEQLKRVVDEYIHYYNHERIKVKLNGLSPVQYRTQAMLSAN
ncbi:IS3 family transposase [Aeromonas rivuli]|uniref:IS3 family transposase n=1 Tax=Aeromonas rivuli TaxID=648794 RepID=UPI001CCA6C61|nr:IS3 family transposase [Aeromonas rivuli]UBO72397.1 IS3 family transposase [Aeromonas rivuli]UBO73397.1 IS3 family transposase [Aeromonas rivuli]UBO73478.1 IS3 family transposase [Aeromonas rivuli]UBO73503.1 IS3 family transposase [Aeromonas rivuli]UBO73579.1 IS3 family transposase [Aeromonas rivuli]